MFISIPRAFNGNALFLPPMKTAVLSVIVMLCTAVAGFAQDCELLVDRTNEEGLTIRTTREQTFYQHEGRRLRFYMELTGDQMAVAANWYISPKTIPDGQKFNSKKPLILTLTLENGEQVSLTIIEAQPGSGTYKLKYADYMIGGSAMITPEIMEQLKASPIKSYTESLYGVDDYQVTDPILPKYFINTINCLQQ